MSGEERTAKEAWRVLKSIVGDEELLLAIRASRNAECQWLISWVDEVYYPWRARPRGAELCPPATHTTQFFPRIDKAIAAAKRDMEVTAAEFARLWLPAWPADLPDEPMLPGASDWPEQRRTRDALPAQLVERGKRRRRRR